MTKERGGERTLKWLWTSVLLVPPAAMGAALVVLGDDDACTRALVPDLAAAHALLGLSGVYWALKAWRDLDWSVGCGVWRQERAPSAPFVALLAALELGFYVYLPQRLRGQSCVPQRPSSPFALLAVATWVALFFVLFVTYGWLSEHLGLRNRCARCCERWRCCRRPPMSDSPRPDDVAARDDARLPSAASVSSTTLTTPLLQINTSFP